MSRILFINSVCNGSTGTICKNLYKAAEEAGYTCCIAYGRGSAPEGFHTIKIGNQLDIYMHVLKARLFDASGFGSKHATKQFIKRIDEFKPDIIHLHNIHGYYINIEILFDYLKKHPEIKKIWTLHDCWAFTGHCCHFQYENCIKWKRNCYNCIKKKEYPKSLIDRCSKNYIKKKNILNCINNLTLIVPSHWLNSLVRQSFLNKYICNVIHNGIDTKLFQYTNSCLREKYSILDKKIILGVSSIWNNKKGLNTFIKLSNNLDSKYQIVLIGLNKKQILNLSSKILGIVKTESIEELIKWYSTADLFLNPTMEDNYPTVNLEAQSCGTTVLASNVGGCKETLKFCNTKSYQNINEILDYINNLPHRITPSPEELSKLDKSLMIKKYLDIY